PEEGCPIGRGGTCLDRACAGLYDCVDGKWTLVRACAPNNVVDAGNGDGGPDGCTPPDVGPKAGAGTCSPDLELPDCPLAAAACAETACSTGCTDFFACEPEGWLLVAYCDEDGHFVPKGR